MKQKTHLPTLMIFYLHHLSSFGEGISVSAFLKDFIYVLLNHAT